MLVVSLLTVLLFFGSRASADDSPIVDTPLGKLRGHVMTSRAGSQFLAFNEIPYAKPPVGKLRFQPPEAVAPWQGIRNATTDNPVCIQFQVKPLGVEDCLYLSVYTKKITGRSPVLVHFHGGAFVAGTSDYAKPNFLIDEDLVVVSANYRLGVLGFLTFENAEYPGNQGLKDQALVLRWVKENIASFGGDPNLVTISGESAGGASVYHHIVSPLSKGLFHRAIAESGTSYAIWAVTPPGTDKALAEKMLNMLGCPITQKEGMECAMKKDAIEFVTNHEKFKEWQVDPLRTFGPVLEAPRPGSFLVGPISEWVHEPVPLLMGTTSAEGLLRTVYFIHQNTSFTWLSENFNKWAPLSLIYSKTASNPDEISNKLREFYFSNKEITMNDWVNLTTMYSDAWFIVPGIEGANKHNGNVYFYYFDYKPKSNRDPSLEKYFFGASHCLESGFIWYYGSQLKDQDEMLSKSLVKALATFVKNGAPEIEGTNITWEPWTPENHYYVHIDKQGYHLEKGLAEDRYSFWNSINYRDNYDKHIPK